MQHVPHETMTCYLSVTYMNYIQQLQADKADTLAAAQFIETEINHLISYLSCPEFDVDTRVQVGDVLRDLLLIRKTVIYMVITLSIRGTNNKNNLTFLLLYVATCRILGA
jgi:hypothetical protein